MTTEQQIQMIISSIHTLSQSVAELNQKIDNEIHDRVGDEYNIVANVVDGTYYLNRSQLENDVYVALLEDVDNGYFIYDTTFDGDEGVTQRFVFDNFTDVSIRIQFELATSDIEEVLESQNVGSIDEDGNPVQPDYSEVTYTQTELDTGYIISCKRLVITFDGGEFATAVEDIPVNDTTRQYLQSGGV